jgi:hypothetical protein
MNSIKNTFAMTVLAGVLSTNAVTSARAEDATWTLKPLNGLSFDVGAKRALSYFLSETGQCKLTLIVANQMLGDEVPTDTPVRARTRQWKRDQPRRAPDGNVRLSAAAGFRRARAQL